MTHPVLKNLSQLLLEASKIEQKQDEELIYNKFANNLELSAQAFHDLGTDAFKAAEIVQHGLHLLNCMLYQFFPNIEQKMPREENYFHINKFFWGKYFYKNGIYIAKQADPDRPVSAWEAAKLFAHEFWKFGQDEFPETIGPGYQFLLENEPKEKIEFVKIESLLTRFGYSEEINLGFAYFLGLCVTAMKKGEDKQTAFKRLARLPDVDVNSEYEELLGPLRDSVLNDTFDELVWRFNGEFESRKVQIEKMLRPVFIYKFQNNGMILKDDQKVQNLFDAEIIFSQGMKVIGQELRENNYNPIQSYKAGLCSANLRAQADYKTTALAGSFFDAYLPLIFGAANSYTLNPDLSWEGHLDIQIPLQRFLTGLKYELGLQIWSFQSYLLFSKAEPRYDILELGIEEFMSECKATLLNFHSQYPEKCMELALARDHWEIFPALSDDYDERQLILTAIKEHLGFADGDLAYKDILTLKSLIIFGYFCSLCETLVLQSEKSIMH